MDVTAPPMEVEFPPDLPEPLPAYANPDPYSRPAPDLPGELPEPLPAIDDGNVPWEVAATGRSPTAAQRPEVEFPPDLPEPVEGLAPPSAPSGAHLADGGGARGERSRRGTVPETETEKELLVYVERRAGPRRIIGDTGAPGMIVTVRDPGGNVRVAVSGTAAQFGAGGFEIPLPASGTVSLEYGETRVPLRVADETVVVRSQETGRQG